MIKPSTITQWLQQPNTFSDADRKVNAALLKAYPYFIPARLLDASEQHKKQSFAPSLLTNMQLFLGNWLLFQLFLDAAKPPLQGDTQRGADTPLREIFDQLEDPDTATLAYESELEDIEDVNLDEADEKLLYSEIEDEELEEFEKEAERIFQTKTEESSATPDVEPEPTAHDTLAETPVPEQHIEDTIRDSEFGFSLKDWLEETGEDEDRNFMFRERDEETSQDDTASPDTEPENDLIELVPEQKERSDDWAPMSDASTDESLSKETPALTESAPDESMNMPPIQDEDVHQFDETEPPTELDARPMAATDASEHEAVDAAAWTEEPALKTPSVPREDDLIQPIFTDDYFLHQGLQISNRLPPDSKPLEESSERALMIVMSFTEWLQYFKARKQQAIEEEEAQRALKTMWQKEKLAEALEEEHDEIPENVFTMAVNSIAPEESLASESLAEVLMKQGKYDRSIEMYRKLSLRMPQKKAYFAARIEQITKLKQ